MHTARDVMTTNVITINGDATIEQAIALLLEFRISGTPVIDDQQRLVGIISEYQLLEAVYTPEIKKQRVQESMTKDVMTVGEDATLSEMANLFILHRIRRIPVVRDDKVVGIVTRGDLLRHTVTADETSEAVPAEAAT